MNTKITKVVGVLGCMLTVIAHGQTQNPPSTADLFKEGITPVEITQAEKDELASFVDGRETGLKRVLRLAHAMYPKEHDCDVDKRIEMYIEAINQIIPETALDLNNHTVTLLRIALNQGRYLDQQMRKESYWTHKFREDAMLFAINEAINLYQSDIQLFQSKTPLEYGYMAYATDFANFVLSQNDRLTRHEAATFYNESAQLLLNVLLAKGNILSNTYAEEVSILQDVQKMTSYENGRDSNKKKCIFGHESFSDVSGLLQKKWANHLASVKAEQERIAEENAQRKRDEMQSRGDRVALYVFNIAKYPNTFLAKDFEMVKRLPGVYDEITFTAIDRNGTKSKEILVCAIDPLVQSGVYLEGSRTPWLGFQKPEDCFGIYKGAQSENSSNASWSSPYGADDLFIISTAGNQFVDFKPFQ